MRLVCLLLAALFGLAGCAGQSGNAAPEPGPADGGDGRTYTQLSGPHDGRDGPYGTPGQTGRGDDAALFDEDTAARLERLAESVQGVNEATCVVLGKVAIIGIDVDGNLDRGKVGSVKYAVAEALAKDPAGVRTAVTADLDIRSRLKGIRDRVEQGRPIRGLAEQFAELVGRVMPQLPRDTAPKAEPKGHPDDRRKAGQEAPQQQGPQHPAPRQQQQRQHQPQQQ